MVSKLFMNAVVGLWSFWLLCNSVLKMAKIGVKDRSLSASGHHAVIYVTGAASWLHCRDWPRWISGEFNGFPA